jgi:SAM-dependent methyltransferase
MLEPFGAAVLEAAAVEPGENVLDIGCGNGATTRAAAVASADGFALGIDLSEAMLERARELALEQGVGNVTFEGGDAQTRAFDPEFDAAISRFGVMFFEDPDAAFTNIRTALREDGRVAFAVWQELMANDWIAVPGAAMLEYVELPTPEPGAPGPFALADIDRVRTIFSTAGFRDLSIDAFEAPLLIGGRGTLDEAVAFMRNTGFARLMLDEQSDEIQGQALDAMRTALLPHLTDEGVQLQGATWLITARR